MAKAKSVLKIVDDLNKLTKENFNINIYQEEKRVVKMVNDLKDTLISYSNVEALSAPQIGYHYRLFCLKFADNSLKAFINPMITKREGLHLSRESNASIPGKEFIVPRNNKIIMTFQTPTGKIEENIFEGVVAEVIQQQVNLLDNIFLSDFGLEVIPEFDKASDEEKQEVIDWWLKELKSKNEELNKEIEADENLLQTKKAIEFMTKVATGEVKVEQVELKKDEN